MEEIQEQNVSVEPEVSENSTEQQTNEGQAQAQMPDGVQADAPSELILGKFKSVEDLSKAYQELQKHQGIQSQELGDLRQNSAAFNLVQNAWTRQNELYSSASELQQTAEKYRTYFEDPSFRDIYKEAYVALGRNLDTDRLVNLIEGYVSSRIFALEKSKAAQAETQKAIDSMSFSKNETNSFNPPKKRLDEMTPKEMDELLEKLI